MEYCSSAGLQFLVRLHKDMGLPETTEYMNKLKKAEKIREVREQRVISASSRQPINVGVFGQPAESIDSLSGGKFSLPRYRLK